MDKNNKELSNSRINVGCLFTLPKLDTTAIMSIQPLAPLSMVASIPGSYYRTLGEPTVHMIYGALENAMGWHFSAEIRKDILKKMQKHYKKLFKIDSLEDYKSSEVNYVSLLQNHVKISKPVPIIEPYVQRYEDYWTQHLKDSDRRHLGGSRNYDWRLENAVNSLEDDDAKNTFFKENKSNFPKYYSSPKKREFVVVEGMYRYKIESSQEIINVLNQAITNVFSPIYLGTNEGWIDINIRTL